MKFKFYLPVMLLALVISSCSDHVYAPALRLADIAYMPKPLATDSAKAANYVSGGFGIAKSAHYNDVLTSGQLNLSRANTFNHINLAYGVFGVAGNYHNNELAPGDRYYFNNKFFGVAGGRLSANYFIHRGSFDFRIIGFEAAYSNEFGNYSSFRKAIGNQDNYHADSRTDLFSMGATTEIVFRNRHNYQFGLRGFIGGTFGSNSIYNRYTDGHALNTDRLPNGPGFATIAYFMQIKNFITVVELSSYAQIRVGYRF
ncbi:hypothetical protein [Mucilaginibacter sp. FT3.2]|uniref:hypothetical protein n=1 Tax=Mucilaginibacter sp. FT3.2 TaxID=2723090 RepID=UPI00160A787A|nr:hypothetical protein [Mucilaginibacter sp. FT3.2]MBB6232051.1 hypothetical protein [Mucilaginibacter sp. FT3.2]